MNNNWIIEHDDFRSEDILKKNETLFTLGNGYLGLRGDLKPQGLSFQSGTYINGFYEKGPIRYGEKAYGYAENWQTMIGIPEGDDTQISMEGNKLFTGNGRFLENSRVLDMKRSLTKWSFKWECEDGNIIIGSLITIIPFEMLGTILFIWDFEIEKDGCLITIESPLTYKPILSTDAEDPRISANFNSKSIKLNKLTTLRGQEQLQITTTGSELLLSCGMNHMITGFNGNNYFSENEYGIKEKWVGQAEKRVQIVKVVNYSYDKIINKNTVEENVFQSLKKVHDIGFKKILEKQEAYMNNFWNQSDIEVTGNDDIQKSLRFNFFHLLQSTGQDGKRSIAAKGLSGPGYEGHYFWDAETYVLPFFIYTNPSIAKSMIMYRISILGQAEARAKNLGFKGILFPWRTINGEESSAYYPAGTAQYHINADIALGLAKYLEVTGDKSILEVGGDKILFGTATFWCSLASFIKGKGYCFNTVTGPDEYTAIVDNNYFTNLMAKTNLEASIKWLSGISSKQDIDKWTKVAQSIYLPIRKEITPQDDTFLEKEVWDFEGTEESKYPLLLHFHPLNIYRKQVLKQADVVLAQSMFRNNFPPGLTKRNFDYYEHITTRDSSLSACAQGINAFWLGYDDLTWEYFLETVHTDLKDLHENVFYGLHTASMGGAFLLVMNGFLGMEVNNNFFRFRPRLPKELNDISCHITIKNSQLNIKLENKYITYTAADSDVVFYHFSNKIILKKGDNTKLSVDPEVKLTLNNLKYDNMYELEEHIFKLIKDNNVLPEETVIVAADENSVQLFKDLGYFSISKKNYRNSDLKKLNLLLKDFKNSNKVFNGFRPRT